MYDFEWDKDKETLNYQKHHIGFEDAKNVFFDTKRIIIQDAEHSDTEQRFFCIGMVNDKIITVRFTMRGNNIRIIGAGYWRKGKKLYEER